MNIDWKSTAMATVICVVSYAILTYFAVSTLIALPIAFILGNALPIAFILGFIVSKGFSRSP